MSSITISPEALTHLKEFVSQDPTLAGLRLAVVGYGCSGYGYKWAVVKEAKPDDTVFLFDGLMVYVDFMSIQYLDGLQIGWQQTLEGGTLAYFNPGRHTCGCGHSFA